MPVIRFDQHQTRVCMLAIAEAVTRVRPIDDRSNVSGVVDALPFSSPARKLQCNGKECKVATGMPSDDDVR